MTSFTAEELEFRRADLLMSAKQSLNSGYIIYWEYEPRETPALIFKNHRGTFSVVFSNIFQDPHYDNMEMYIINVEKVGLHTNTIKQEWITANSPNIVICRAILNMMSIM